MMKHLAIDPAMNTPVAIVVAAVILAAALLVAFRWEVVIGRGYPTLLDRWTGRVVACNPPPTIKGDTGGFEPVRPNDAGIVLSCRF